jgi:agmatine deiminase
MPATPAKNGFAMPGEWTPHTATLMAWPCRADLWGSGLSAARQAYANVANRIAGFEPVTMIANGEDTAAARAACGTGIEILPLPIDDSWMRDSGPTFVVNQAGDVAGIDWQFNAWGGKFPPWDRDAAIAGKILNHLNMRGFDAPFVQEGGAFHVDGDGTLITTEQCLLNKNRNPTLSRADIETYLSAYLGVTKIIWLGKGLENDHTDGHVDDITCFIRPGAVLTAICGDSNDANHAPLAENLRRLKNARDAKNRSLDIVTLPLPARRDIAGVGRLAASYINFYLANGAVIVPGFDDPADARACAILQEAFPTRKITLVPALPIIAGGGSIHCITQQIPRGPAAPRS